nr:hypothetical protein [Crucivirus sp.]
MSEFIDDEAECSESDIEESNPDEPCSGLIDDEPQPSDEEFMHTKVLHTLEFESDDEGWARWELRAKRFRLNEDNNAPAAHAREAVMLAAEVVQLLDNHWVNGGRCPKCGGHLNDTDFDHSKCAAQ